MSTDCTQEFVCTWKIRNFSLCFQKLGEKLESSVFRVDCFGGSEWFLEIYPKGWNKDYKGFVSLFLRQKNPSVYSEKIDVKYTLSMGTNTNFFESNTVENQTFTKNLSWGWRKFVKIETVMNELKGSGEDILIIRCVMLSKYGPDRSPIFETCTDIGANFTSFLWNVKIEDSAAESARKCFTINNQLNYEMTFTLANDSAKICVIRVENEPVLPTLVVCKLSLLNPKGKEMYSKTARHLFESTDRNEVWEFPSFISKNILESDETVLKENTISLLCELAASNGMVSTKVVGSKCDMISDEDDDVSVLHKELKSMLLNNVHSDVILKADGKEVHAHKSVLAARSSVFAAMFEQDMIESQTGIVHIADVEINTLKLFLEFIYTATVDKMDYDKAKKLLVAADKYQVFTLKEKCASYLESVISLINVCDILSVADMVDHQRLKHMARSFIFEHSAKIFNTPEWFGLIESNVELANDIFSNIAVNFDVSPKTRVLFM